MGSSGSGKSTVAQRLSETLGVPRLELDSVMHQPGWKPLPPDLFRERVAGFASGDAWVIDGNYTGVGTTETVWPRADAFVWLDLPKSVVMSQVTRRTLRRLATREELWNGNRESWTNMIDPRPEKNIVLWAFTTHRRVRERYETALSAGVWAHAEVHRLRSRAEIDDFLGDLAAQRS